MPSLYIKTFLKQFLLYQKLRLRYLYKRIHVRLNVFLDKNFTCAINMDVAIFMWLQHNFVYYYSEVANGHFFYLEVRVHVNN